MPLLTKTKSSPPPSIGNKDIQEDSENAKMVKQKTKNEEEMRESLISPIFERKSSIKKRETLFNSMGGQKKSPKKMSDEPTVDETAQSLPKPQ